MLELPCSPSTCGVRELEWPQKVGGLQVSLITQQKKKSVGVYLFEVRSSSDDFMDKILDAKNIKLSKGFFDNSIVCKRNALLIDLAVSAFVDQLSNRLQVGFTNKESITDPPTTKKKIVPICNIGLDKTEHLLSRPCSFDENTVINLK